MGKPTINHRQWKRLLNHPGQILKGLAVALSILGFFGLISIWNGWFDQIISDNTRDIVLSLSLMGINISFTVLLINSLEKQRFRILEKRELIKQMARGANRFATEAVQKLGLRGWLRDGSLEGEVFASANLANVHLEGSMLRKADLSNADLKHAKFDDADLSEAILFGADLTDTSLKNVKLDRARLSDPKHLGIVMPRNLEGTAMRQVLAKCIDLKERNLKRSVVSGDLAQAQLQHSDLSQANLSSANLDQADFCDAYLTKARFDRAVLIRAKFPSDGRRLAEASFTSADLTGVDFSKTSLAEVETFAKAKLDGTKLPKSLCKLNFCGAQIKDVDLTNRDLSGARFIKANLKGICLRGADLSGADFEGADLRGADLSYSTVDSNTSFKHANLQSNKTRLPTTLGLTNLEEANLSGTDLSGCNLSNGRLGHAHLEDTLLPKQESWLKKMNLRSATLVRTHLCNRLLSEVDFTDATLKECSFERAKLVKVSLPKSLSSVRFAGAKMDGLDLQKRDFTGVDLTDASLCEAELQGTIFRRAILSRADFSNAFVDKETDCTDAQFAGKATKLPERLKDMILSGASFSDVRLPRNLAEINLAGVTMANLDLSKCKLRKARIIDCDLSGANLSGTDCYNATFRGGNLTGAKLCVANCTYATFEHVPMEKACFSGIKLTGATLLDMELLQVDLSNENLQNAALNNVNLSGATLKSTNLLGAKLIDVTLRNAKLSSVMLDNAEVRNLVTVDGADFENASMYRLKVDEASRNKLAELVPSKTINSWLPLAIDSNEQ